jgi:broad specificity phosphatase PhoE
MICKLFVFRHAETFDNSSGVFSGWRDSVLTPKGLMQAQEIAEQLKKHEVDYAFSSHLKRARRTLEIVLQGRSSVQVFTDDRLMERCYGQLQGKEKKKMKLEDPDLYAQIHRGYRFVPPDGESLEMVENRVMSFLEQLRKWLKQNPGNVAISCHSNSIRPFRRVFENLSTFQMCNLESPQNCAIMYEIRQGNLTNENIKGKTNKQKWKGIVISRKVKLATDPMNLLSVYYH